MGFCMHEVNKIHLSRKALVISVPLFNTPQPYLQVALRLNKAYGNYTRYMNRQGYPTGVVLGEVFQARPAK